MAKKILFEVRERSADPAFQVVEDDNGEIQTHYGATYNSEANVRVGVTSQTNIDGSTSLDLGSKTQSIFESHYVTCTLGAVSATSYVDALGDISTVLLDSHNLVNAVDNVVLNPFYGLRDSFITGSIQLLWAPTAAPGPADYKSAIFAGGITLGAIAPLITRTYPSIASAVYGQTTEFPIPITKVGIDTQFLGVLGNQASAGSLMFSGSFSFEIFG